MFSFFQYGQQPLIFLVRVTILVERPVAETKQNGRAFTNTNYLTHKKNIEKNQALYRHKAKWLKHTKMANLLESRVRCGRKNFYIGKSALNRHRIQMSFDVNLHLHHWYQNREQKNKKGATKYILNF